MTLDETMAKYPTLCAIGLGISNFHPPMRDALDQLDRSRAGLRDARDEIETATRFLERCTLTVTGRIYSYGLKHTAESWGKWYAGVPYVSNGALIAAALMGGVVVEPCERASVSLNALGSVCPNAWIGVSRRSVNAVSRETRAAERAGRAG